MLKVYHPLSCHREEYEHEVEHLGTSENNAISEFIHYHLVLKKAHCWHKHSMVIPLWQLF